MIAPISDARLEEALAILDRLGPAGSTEEQSEPNTPAAAALPASEPAAVVENPAASPNVAFAATAPSGTQLGLEATADAAATSDHIAGSTSQPVAATSPPSKRARNERWRSAPAEAAHADLEKGSRYTDAEDAAILEHIAQYGNAQWDRCAETVGGGRPATGVWKRWHGRLKETDRGRAALTSAPDTQQHGATWTDAEDALLLEHVAQYGAGDWVQCAKTVGGGRTEPAVYTRWHHFLRKTDCGRAALATAPDD